MEKDLFILTYLPFPLQLFPVNAFLQTGLSFCSGDPSLFHFLKAIAL